MKYKLAALTIAGLMLAQMNSYNGGIPITPGTSVPESNPAIDRPVPRYSAPPVSPAAAPAIGLGSGGTSAPAGPAYSFGAAPSPIISVPGH